MADDYTRDIAKLKGIEAGYMGPVGSALMGAPEAIASTGAALKGVGDTLDQARFNELKAQGIKVLETAAKEAGHTPAQMQSYKMVWETEDGPNKAWQLWANNNALNQKAKDRAAQFSFIKSQTGGNESDAYAAQANIDALKATGQNVDLAPESGAVGGIGAPIDQTAVSGSPEPIPGVETAPAGINPVIPPALGESVTLDKTGVTIAEARAKAAYLKSGGSEADYKKLEPFTKMALNELFTDKKAGVGEKQKILKEISKDPAMIEALGDPQSPLSAWMKTFPEDPKVENNFDELKALATLKQNEENNKVRAELAQARLDAASQRRSDANSEVNDRQQNMREDKFWQDLQKFEQKENVVSFKEGKDELTEVFGLFGSKPSAEFANSGFIGFITNTSPNIANAVAAAAETLKFDSVKKAVDKARNDQDLLQKLAFDTVLKYAATTFNIKTEQKIQQMLGINKFSSPQQMKMAIERMVFLQEKQLKNNFIPLEQRARDLNIDLTGISDLVTARDLSKESAQATPPPASSSTAPPAGGKPPAGVPANYVLKTFKSGRQGWVAP